MLEAVRNIVWSVPTVALLAVSGLYFTLKSRLFQLTGLKRIFADAFSDLRSSRTGGVSAGAALATALGGTVGIGSIAGVGLALAEGGPGSIFWMWVTGLLGCMLKYAEINVAVRYRKRGADGVYAGGAMYALGQCGKRRAAVFFALICIPASICTGCLTQSSAVSSAVTASGMSAVVSGAITAVSVLLAATGGRKLITGVSSALIPTASIVYLLMAAVIIAVHIDSIPSVLADIFGQAFGARQAGAGVAGYTLSAVMRTGVVRGIYSSEAGMGSSALVHAASETAEPHRQGGWGIIEMTADIFVFSTITAFALLSCGVTDVSVMFTRSFGVTGSVLLPVLLAVFGFASIISWCFYAESCLAFLCGNKTLAAFRIYGIVAAAASFAGAVAAAEAVWALADIFNALMMAPNMYLLFLKRKEICECFGRKKQQRLFTASLKREETG